MRMAQQPVKLQFPLLPRFFENPGDSRTRWLHWKAQLDNFFVLTNLTLPGDNALTDAAKNASLLDSEGSRILMAHPVATQASAMTYDAFSQAVGLLFERPTNPVRAEFEFRSRKQGASETVAEYLTALRTLHVDCNRQAEETHNLAMQLALGCYDRRTQEKLLTETTVNLNRFIQIMQADETAHASSAAIRHDHAAVATVSHRPSRSTAAHNNRHSAARNPPHNQTKPCRGCGKDTHRYKDISCPAFNKTFSYCRHLHHFSSVCIKKRDGKSIACVAVNTATITPAMSIRVTLTNGNHDLHLAAMMDTGSAISTVNNQTARVWFTSVPSNRHCSTQLRRFHHPSCPPHSSH